jgi:hypothetical protein
VCSSDLPCSSKCFYSSFFLVHLTGHICIWLNSVWSVTRCSDPASWTFLWFTGGKNCCMPYLLILFTCLVNLKLLSESSFFIKSVHTTLHSVILHISLRLGKLQLYEMTWKAFHSLCYNLWPSLLTWLSYYTAGSLVQWYRIFQISKQWAMPQNSTSQKGGIK